MYGYFFASRWDCLTDADVCRFPFFCLRTIDSSARVAYRLRKRHATTGLTVFLENRVFEKKNRNIGSHSIFGKRLLEYSESETRFPGTLTQRIVSKSEQFETMRSKQFETHAHPVRLGVRTFSLWYWTENADFW